MASIRPRHALYLRACLAARSTTTRRCSPTRRSATAQHGREERAAEEESDLVHRFIQVIQFPPIRLCPDLFRASTKTDEAAAAAVDGRVKPGHERMGESSESEH